MLALRELQAAFGRAMLGAPPDPLLLAGIAGDGRLPFARLAIYRHHVETTLGDVLRSIYPVVARLVDERFFAYAAHEFIRAHPPASPRLHEYGAALPAFLAQFPPTRPLGHLPDVARREWALHLASDAADRRPVELAALSAVAPEAWARAVLHLHPAVSFVESRWPVDRIWVANRPDAAAAEPVDLAAGGVRLEVSRDGATPGFRGLTAAAFALRKALGARRPLADAVAGALDTDPDLDVTRALRALFEEGAVVDVTFNP
jgi:hypothetical protein